MFELTRRIVLRPTVAELLELERALGGVGKPRAPCDEDETACLRELLSERREYSLADRCRCSELIRNSSKFVDEISGLCRRQLTCGNKRREHHRDTGDD